MRVSVIQGGKSILHVGGDVDVYSLETLRDYLTRILQRSINAKVLVSMDPDEEAAFRHSAERWVQSLKAAGVSVSLSGPRTAVSR